MSGQGPCADEYVYARLVYYIMLEVCATKQITKHKITAAATCMCATERARRGRAGRANEYVHMRQ